jgi:hypothetical protein
MAVDLAELVDAEQPEELQEPGPDEDAYLQEVSLYQLHSSCLFGQLQSTQCPKYILLVLAISPPPPGQELCKHCLSDCSNYRCRGHQQF